MASNYAEFKRGWPVVVALARSLSPGQGRSMAGSFIGVGALPLLVAWTVALLLLGKYRDFESLVER
jgi:hypothetical protein